MASFDENGKYIKTNWKAGDKITATKLNKIEESIEAVNDNDISRHVEADARLDALEAKDVAHDKEFTNVKNTIADNKAAAELGDYEINSRMTFLEEELNEGIEEVHNVASTVDGKIAQGKADMEAMVAEVEADLEGLHAKTDFVYPEMFGAIGDGATDDTEAFNQMFNTNKRIRFIKDATYSVGNVSLPSNTDMKSDYNTTLLIFQKVASNPVLLGVRSGCKIENIKFICTVESLEWNRCDIAHNENILFKNCLFEGFRHASDRPNAWGIYLENSKNIEIRNCEFNDNSQSDIAILDGCENIIIDNCKGDAFHINFEPNGSATLKNVNISNCNIDRLNTLENSYTKVTIEDVIISNCVINRYCHRGGNVTLHNTKINNIYEDGDRYCGKFNENSSLTLGRNLLSDSKIVDLANSGPNDTHCWYGGYMPHSKVILRGIDEFGEYLSFNPNKINTLIQISTRIPVVPNETYCLKLTASSIYTAGSSWNANHGRITILDAEGTSVYSKKIILNQGAIGTTVMPSEKTTFIHVPENGVELVMLLSNTDPTVMSATEFKVYNVRLSRVLREPGMISHDDDKIYVKNKPAAVNAGGINNVFLAGQKVYIKEPVAGGYLGYICTESGNPGVWKGFGLIES